MDTGKDEATLARRRAQNREAQRKFRREYRRYNARATDSTDYSLLALRKAKRTKESEQ